MSLLYLVIASVVIIFAVKLTEYNNTISAYKEMIDDHQEQIAKLQNIKAEYENQNSKNDLMLSDRFFENFKQLNIFVDYAIGKYCNHTKTDNNYQYNIIDSMLHEQTKIVGDADYRFDLAKEVYPDLSSRKYIYKIEGNKDDLIVIIDTYRMKIFIYLDKRDGNLIVIDDYRQDFEAYENNFELEDYIISDWDDPFIGEYWSFAADGWENLIIPEDMEYNQELYGRVIYALKRYCEENQINEKFSFDANEDIVSLVTNMVFTVKVESENRILYIDLDCRRNKFHIYEIES